MAWALAKSPKVGKLYIAPGNAGTALLGENISMQPGDIEALVKFARQEKIDLTVVGPDAALAAGIVDRFRTARFPIFGPTKAAARIEWSKVFAKRLMMQAGIPTAPAEIFDNAEAARRYIDISGAPCVVKTDGLAAGKGVTVAMTEEEAYNAINEIMTARVFGEAGASILIEDYISGEEASVFCIADGHRYVVMLPSQDHKRLREGGEGPNTGGMGAYAPAPVIDSKLLLTVCERIIEPTLAALADAGTPFTGCLYLGLMVDFEGPKVLEYNARFGDPEAQVILPLLQDDFFEILTAATAGKLDAPRLNWKPGAAATVIAASKGYPGPYETGKPIKGLEKITDDDHIIVFHAGTKTENNKVVTAGGRVLAVTALSVTIHDAVKRAYEALGKIHFAGMVFRRDIGHKALMRRGE